MKTYSQIIWVVLVLVVTFAGFAKNAQANQTLTNALRQAEQGNIGNALGARSALNGTARDTLDWYIYYKGHNSLSFSEISGFLQKHPQWPYSISIQKEAEKRLNGHSLDATAMRFFDAKTPVTAKAMRAYVDTLIAQGNAGKAKQVLNKWWTKANLSRDEQRQIYGAYGQYLTRASNIERMNHLLNKREYTNGVAIGSSIGGGYGQLATARRALGQNKSDVNGLINAVPASLSNDEGLLFDRLKWRRKKGLTQGAIEILDASPSASQMSDPSRWWKERHIIVRRLMENKQYSTAYRVASSHKQVGAFPQLQAEWISGFIALRLANQPHKAFRHFEALYKAAKSPISKGRGAYWAGRASEALNRGDVAAKWYAVSSKYPETFYGQLAGEKIGRQVALNMRGSSNPNLMPRSDLASAAIYLSNAGLKKEAEAFLFRLKKHAGSASDYEALANLANKVGQQHVAIKAAQDLQKQHGVVLGRYLYPQKTTELRNVGNVEWALVNAIIRQESRFDQTAKSHAGARGLMQLMPATAKETAARAGIKHQTAWLTSRPSHNITLGSKYLGQMVNRFNGNYAMAAAAYNAGPGRVDRWIKQFGDPRTSQIDFIDWAEQIPIYETRNYVQRVLEGVYVYRQSLKGTQPQVNRPIHVATR